MRVVKLKNESYSSNAIKWNGGILINDDSIKCLILLPSGQQIIEYWANLEEIKEEWKAIPTYEGLYEVSNFGRFKALDRTYYCGTRRSKRFKPEHLLKYDKNNSGYLALRFCKDGIVKKKYCHVVIANVFIPNAELKPQVNHRDGVKSNLFCWNLEWNTPSENTQHAYDNGLTNLPKGKNHHNSKIVLDTATGIYYDCLVEAAKARCINYSTLNNKLSGNNRNNTSLIYV